MYWNANLSAFFPLRLILPIFSLSLVLVHSASAETTAVSSKKYPPYPEVWGYEVGTGDISYLCKAKDGDFYIFSGEYYKDLPKTKIIGLFSGSVIELSAREAEAVARESKPIAGLGQLECREYYNYPSSVTLPNGYTIRTACVGGSCQHPFGVGAEVVDQADRVVTKKVLLYLLEEPRTISIPRPAAEGGAIEITGRVVQLDPHFVSLGDNTFLFVGRSVARFDNQFNTSFPVNRDRFFVVDATLVEELYREASEKASSDEAAWHKLVQEILATQLEKIKREKH